ncbi:MAG: hypothetical protein EBS84_08395 [Proteobacteria bacterium]|nr:hypothetical protein [Verrucomicrobiota bacterium]NBU09019.1 hypothetical protein [Pseudomonadota bacterium]
MELALQQKLVARLATDREFREKFFGDPARVAAHEGLTVAAETLSAIHQEQMRQFARLLRTRRLAQVALRLPLTRKALGQRFADCFRNYAVTPPPPGQRPTEDAIAFAQHLESHTAEYGLDPAWALSLARYEAARLSAEWEDRRLVIRALPHHVKRLATLLAAGEIPPGDYRRFSLAIWWRPTASSLLKHWLS